MSCVCSLRIPHMHTAPVPGKHSTWHLKYGNHKINDVSRKRTIAHTYACSRFRVFWQCLTCQAMNKWALFLSLHVLETKGSMEFMKMLSVTFPLVCCSARNMFQIYQIKQSMLLYYTAP